MAQSRRVLFVAGEVTPFAETSSIASLARTLPEQLQEASDFEARVMMPCYGSIDERSHNLHEVIRLSGTDVPMGDETETLTVKVASVPDVRLQVYFMDHDAYFGNEAGMTMEETSSPEEVLRRALFFNRAALETIRKLRWGPDVIHSFGWMSSLIPLLLRSEYGEGDVLGHTKSVFTAGDQDPGTQISLSLAQDVGLPLDENAPVSFSETGSQYADASIAPSGGTSDGAVQFDADEAQRGQQLATLYDQMLNEVPA